MSDDETVVLHGDTWKLSDIRELIDDCLTAVWRPTKWASRAAIVSNDGRGSQTLYVGQAFNADRSHVEEDGWTHDHCEICWFTLSETEDPESGEGHTDGHKWVCNECFHKLLAPRGVPTSA